MADAAEIADAAPPAKPRGKLGLILGLVAALALGGGGFYAVFAGLVDPTPPPRRPGEAPGAARSVLGDIAFVPMEPIMISLAPGAAARHLRFSGQLEVAPEHAAEVSGLMPRVLDVLNTYLRAVEVATSRSRPPSRGCGRRCCGASRSSPAKAGCATFSSPNSC